MLFRAFLILTFKVPLNSCPISLSINIWKNKQTKNKETKKNKHKENMISLFCWKGRIHVFSLSLKWMYINRMLLQKDSQESMFMKEYMRWWPHFG